MAPHDDERGGRHAGGLQRRARVGAAALEQGGPYQRKGARPMTLVSEQSGNLVIEKNVMVPMRDGVRLASDVYRRFILRCHPEARGDAGTGGAARARALRHHRPVLRELGVPGRRVPARLQPALGTDHARLRRAHAPARQRRRVAGPGRAAGRRDRRQRRAVPPPPAARRARARRPWRRTTRTGSPTRRTTRSGRPSPRASPTGASPCRPSTWAAGTTCSSRERWRTTSA